MLREKTKKLCTLGITIGLGFAAVAQMDGYIQKLIGRKLPLYLAPSIAGIGVTMAVTGAIVYLFCKLNFQPETSHFECYPAKGRDLPAIYQLAFSLFGDDVSPLQSMIQWHEKNKYIFHTLYAVKSSTYERRKRIVGYFALLPLKETAIRRLESGSARAKHLSTDDIHFYDENWDAVFIGAVVAIGFRARATILSLVQREITSFCVQKTSLFYTRPITNDGLRLVKKFNFLSIDPSKQGEADVVYRIKLETGDQDVITLKSRTSIQP